MASLVKQHVKDDYSVIIIDNSNIAKPASKKMEVLSELRDGSTSEITQGYLTIDTAVLFEKGKMPLPVYEKVFSAAKLTKTYVAWNLFPKTLPHCNYGFL